jgi:ABC-2 type transport system permease protein
MSFWLLSVGQFFTAFFSFTGLVILFSRFKNLGEWSFWETALCFGISYVVFAFTECIARGFDIFSRMIASGDFDRIMLRPRSTLLQVMGVGFEITRIGSLLQGAIVLSVAIYNIDIVWNMQKIVIIAMMTVCGIGVFLGIFILGAAVCFVTVQGVSFINVFANVGREFASYPMTIYSKYVKRFFTFIIPFGTINFLPLLYLTGRIEGGVFVCILPFVISVIFFIICLTVWNLGVSRYTSTGS